MSDKYLRTDKQNLLNALGTELCWGWSPAVDVLQLLTDYQAQRQEVEQTASSVPQGAWSRRSSWSDRRHLNILLCGSCDVRHILLTLSRVVRHVREDADNKTSCRGAAAAAGPAASVSPVAPLLRFFIYEPNLRVHCRHLFFLHLLCDMITLRELEDRIELFLDLFGNVRLRDASASCLKATTHRVLKLLERHEGPLRSVIHPSRSFDNMKSKERDFIEEQLRHWVRDQSRADDVAQQWDQRVRHDLAERYDSRVNIVDWDFNFAVLDYTHTIKFPEYREWRLTGLAFDYCRINPRKGFQYEHAQVNKSLCHFDRKGRGQYVGDIKNGPFFSFGVDTESPHLVKRQVDGQMIYGNGMIAMHNTRAWIYELLTGKVWPFADHKFAWDDEKHYNPLPADAPQDTAQFNPTLPACEMHFVGLDFERFLAHCGQGSAGADAGSSSTTDAATAAVSPPLDDFERMLQEVTLKSTSTTAPEASSATTFGTRRGERTLFDVAFVGCTSTQLMTPTFFEHMSPDGLVIVETIKFVSDACDETKNQFVQKALQMAAAAAAPTEIGGSSSDDEPIPRRGCGAWQHNVRLTASLHKRQPPLKDVAGRPTEAQQRSKDRMAMPFQLVFSQGP